MVDEPLEESDSVLDLGQTDLLLMLSLRRSPGQSAKKLAKALQIKPDAVKRFLAALEKNNLVNRKDESDSFRLTHGGRTMLQHIATARTEISPVRDKTTNQNLTASAPAEGKKSYTNG